MRLYNESVNIIFKILEVVNGFSDGQKNEVSAKIRQRIPAAVILEALLTKYATEINDHKNSFRLAICEFYSDPAVSPKLIILCNQSQRPHRTGRDYGAYRSTIRLTDEKYPPPNMFR